MDLLAFKVVVEPDEGVWASYYPAWIDLGAATWGETQEEAAANIKEVLEMLIEEVEEGQIEWPITPYVPDPEISKPSIQDAPEFVQLNCAPEHPDAIASHGGLPVSDAGPDIAAGDIYRLIYLAVNNDPWHMAWPDSAILWRGAKPYPPFALADRAIHTGMVTAPMPYLRLRRGGWNSSGWNAGASYNLVVHGD